jgi:hypothetical protein
MGRPVLALAMSAYAASFGLAAGSRGDYSLPGLACAYATLVGPLVDTTFFEEGAAIYIPFLISGWINVVFLATLAMRWWEGNGRPFKILRTITLLMIPFCWSVFYSEHAYPREGHVLWIVAMVFALFSDSSSSSGEVPAASTS